MPTLDEMVLQLTLRDNISKPAEKAFGAVGKHAEGATDALEGATESAGDLAGALGKGAGAAGVIGLTTVASVLTFGLAALAAAVVAVTAVVLVGLYAWLKYEKAVLAVRDGAAFFEGQVENLRRLTTDLAMDLGVARHEILELAGGMRSLGLITRSESKPILTFATKFMKATGATASDTAQLVDTLSRGMRLSFTEMQRVSGAMLIIGQRTGLTVRETNNLLAASEQYVARIPKQLREKAIKALIATSGALKQMGIDSSGVTDMFGHMVSRVSDRGIELRSTIQSALGIPWQEQMDILKKGRPELLMQKMQDAVKRLARAGELDDVKRKLDAWGQSDMVVMIDKLADAKVSFLSMHKAAIAGAEGQKEINDAFTRFSMSLSNVTTQIWTLATWALDTLLTPVLERLAPIVRGLIEDFKEWAGDGSAMRADIEKWMDVNIGTVEGIRAWVKEGNLRKIFEGVKSGAKKIWDIGVKAFGKIATIVTVMFDIVMAIKRFTDWVGLTGGKSAQKLPETRAEARRHIAGTLGQFLPPAERLGKPGPSKTFFPGLQGKQHGGYVRETGLARVHAGEFVGNAQSLAQFPSMMSPTGGGAAEFGPLPPARTPAAGQQQDLGPLMRLMSSLVAAVRDLVEQKNSAPPNFAGPLDDWSM